MAKPRLRWYTVDQLAIEWAKYGIRKDEIEHYLENGQLKRWKKFASHTTDKEVFLEAPPISWTEEDEDTLLLNNHRGLYVVFEDGQRPDYIMLEEVERFEQEHGLVVDGNVVRPKKNKTKTGQVQNNTPDRQPDKKGGRQQSQLYQGIEALYLDKLRAGQTDILQRGAVENFMTTLYRISKNDDRKHDKILEHIREVKKRSGHWVVLVQDPPDTGGKFIKKNEKPEGYDKKAISKILSRLRRLYPIE